LWLEGSGFTGELDLNGFLLLSMSHSAHLHLKQKHEELHTWKRQVEEQQAELQV